MTSLDRLRLQRIVGCLLAPFERPGGPGMTLGLVLDDELVVQESAGLASIELGVRIGAGTCFRIASVSKQFTCAAILLLAEEGRLHVEDDVCRWLPEMPDNGWRITLDHLMHNTSGIRDMLEIMRLGGVDLAQPIRHEDLVAGICRQRGLNFPLGSRYLYSNSNFLLLGRVVEKASGKSLGEFLGQRIFGPVGMSATRHVESPAEPVSGLATGYLAHKAGGWRRAQHGFPLHGEGGLVSCVQDLALWHAHLGSPRGAAMAEALTAQLPFSNGRPNAYARGLSMRQYRGLGVVEHGGLWPGYKTAFLRVPDRRLALICITNDGGADPHAVAARALDAVIEGMAGVHPAPRMQDGTDPESFVGRWLDRERGATADVARSDTGDITVAIHGVPFIAQPTEDGRLGAPTSSTQFTFRLQPDQETMEVERDAGAVAIYHRIGGDAMLPPGLSGRYGNDEIAATWTIDGSVLTVAGPVRLGATWSVEPIEGDVIRVIVPTLLYGAWLDVRVLRDAAQQVTGLHVTGGRARELVFRRCDVP
ncbi:MAG TPA: serine hydrolase [Acetobacteraceae bacterium]